MKNDKWHSKKYKNRAEMMSRSWNDARRDKHKSAHGKVMKALWADPVFRKKMEKKRKQQVTKKWRKQNGKRLKKQWSDKKWHKKMCKVRKEQITRKWRKRNSKHIKKLWQDPKYRAKQMKTRNKTMYGNPKWMKKWRASTDRTGKKPWNVGYTKETHPSLLSASNKLAGQIPDYKKGRCWYPDTKNKKIWMRSSWEVKFALWLDSGKIRWEYESKRIHVGKGNWTGLNYIPDFYLPDQNTYIELKGWMSKNNERKMKAVQRLYPELKLWIFRKQHLAKVLAFKRAA